MPKINEIKKAQEIGLKGRQPMVWLSCAICGKEKCILRRGYKQ